MDAVCFQCLQDDMASVKDEEEPVEEGGLSRSYSTDEETDDDSEPEPPPVARRKVSFADAFGLDLVSVKEFDNIDLSESEVVQCNDRERKHSLEEFYMSCLFSVPSSQAELHERLHTQMVELESIELLPGTTTLRGKIRVVNLCYNKLVYARITLDRWNSYFDLLAEYVPGSSDRETDRFTFSYTLVPPFERDGTRVEFCLRYETSLGTFWANNKEMNYVLFCHQRGCIKETEMSEESGFRSKRSCLRAIRNGGAEERTRETITKETLAGGLEERCKKEKADKKTRNQKEQVQLLHNPNDHKSMLENEKRDHSLEHLAHAQDCLPQSQNRVPRTVTQGVAYRLKALDSLPDSQEDQSQKTPQVFTDHQITLLTQNWNNEPQQVENPGMEDIWAGESHITLSKVSRENTYSANNTWESFPKSTDNGNSREPTVCKVWQSFLNAPSSGDHSAIPESAMQQTATSPSNKNDHQIQYTATTQKFQEFQVGADTPTPLHVHTLATCQGLSDSCKTLSANVAFNAKDHQSAKVCDSRPRDDNAATQDASQGSQSNSVIDTLLEFSLKGAPPVSEGSVDSSTECHTSAVWELEKDRIIGGAEKIGDKTITLHTADLVTSSGESETTDMTAMLASQNATAGDRISVGARLHEGLSSRGEGKVTGTASSEMDDMLAFREAISLEIKDGARDVFSASRCGTKKEEEIFTPQEDEKSLKYLTEMCWEKFKLKQNSENTLQEEMKGEVNVQSTLVHPSDFQTNQKCRKNKDRALAFNDDKTVNSNTMEVFNTKETFYDKASKETEKCTWSGLETTCVFDEKESHHSEISGQPVSVALSLPNQSINQSANEEQCIQDRESYCDGIVMNSQEFDPSSQAVTIKSPKMVRVVQSDHLKCRCSLTDDPNVIKTLQPEWSHSQEVMESKKEDDDNTSTEEVMEKESLSTKDTLTQCQPETSHPLKDLMNEDKDESVSSGKLNIEATTELMGNVRDSQEKKGNTLAELKEHKLLAEVEMSSPVEYEKISRGEKDPITSENPVSLEEIEPRVEMIAIERFGEDLIRRIWEDIFSRELQGFCMDNTAVTGVGCRQADIAHAEEIVVQECIQEQPSVTNGCECSSKERNHSLSQQTPIFSQQKTDVSSSAYPSQDLLISFAFQRRCSLTETILALGSITDRENYTTMTERSDTCQETPKDIFLQDSFNRSALPSYKHSESSLGNAKESEGVAWRSVLYIVFHITRFLLCALLVGTFFTILFLYDFSVFVSLYFFSLCWWFYVWKINRTPAKKTNGEVR
ncbi:uncharacterized protein ppp1r3aa [Gouania willdenowi]|uniref:uncharacterized protein ppp1r3aa n=1 Tax=Gouania willdenowi TaxID=441366 RepID=UPI001054D341|nr:protein phosphatase 1 regulatory subunit 3A [Gouania willdenowi]